MSPAVTSFVDVVPAPVQVMYFGGCVTSALISSVLIAFLWRIRRKAEVSTAMVLTASLLLLASADRFWNIIREWLTGVAFRPMTIEIVTVANVTLLVLPLILLTSFTRNGSLSPKQKKQFRWFQIVAFANLTFCAALVLRLALTQALRSMRLELLGAVTLTAILMLASAAWMRWQRLPLRHGAVFFCMVSFGLAGVVTSLLLLLNGTIRARNLAWCRLSADWAATFVVLGALLVYSALPFADVLMKRIVSISWWAIVTEAFYCVAAEFAAGEHHSSLLTTAGGLIVLCALPLYALAMSFGSKAACELVDRWFYRHPDYRLLLDELAVSLHSESNAVELAERAISTITSHVLSVNVALVPVDSPTANPVHSVSSPAASALNAAPRSAARRTFSFPVRNLKGNYQKMVVMQEVTRPPLLQSELNFVQSVVSLFESSIQALEFRALEQQKERDHSVLRAQVLEGELRALRAQLNPHFLFNTLNTIAQYAAVAPDDAERIVVKLASVLRYVLVSTENAMDALEVELKFIGDYLEIERARFGERLSTKFQIDEAVKSVSIPTLLLQPIVENALKHGLSTRASGGTLWLSAFLRGDSLVLRVEDDGVGLRSQAARDSRPHLGIQNTRERLRHVYGEAAELKIGDRFSGGTVVQIIVPVCRRTS